MNKAEKHLLSKPDAFRSKKFYTTFELTDFAQDFHRAEFIKTINLVDETVITEHLNSKPDLARVWGSAFALIIWVKNQIIKNI